METIFYAAGGMAILILSAYLFTYFDTILNNWKHRMTQLRRAIYPIEAPAENSSVIHMRQRISKN